MENHNGIVKTYWERAGSSLWFLPVLLTTAAAVMAFIFLYVDHVYQDFIDEHLSWLFGGTPSAARTLLSTIAASVITVISIAFSLTILAIQQASVQFTTRVLRTFTSDKGNQLVLGTYIATFLYSLMVLRSVRDPVDQGGVGFVPSVSVTGALVLVVICIALLIYFINHIASSLQSITVITRVHSELLRQIDTLYPEQIGKEAIDVKEIDEDELVRSGRAVKAKRGGFIARIEEEALLGIENNGIDRIYVYPKVGDFVVSNEIIARVIGPADISDDVIQQVAAAIVIDKERSVSQDPLFPIRQLVDISKKALSPGVNDQTTANYCIHYLGDAVCILANRRFPGSVRSLGEGNMKLILNKPTWNEFVLGSFSQIQHESMGDVQVSEEMLRVLYKIAQQLPNQERAAPIRQILKLYREHLDSESMLPSDRGQLLSAISRVEKVVDRV